jgi:signal transduction histidine kinase
VVHSVAAVRPRENDHEKHRTLTALASRIATALTLVCAIAGVGTVAAGAPARDNAAAQKKVLVVHASRIDAPYTQLVERAYRKTLGEGLGGRLDYYSEYIDVGRFSTPDHEAALRDFLRRKYADRALDVVIAEGEAPFSFVARNGSEVFPGVPVVFSAEEPDPRHIPNTTGVAFSVNMKATLDIALRLQPQVKQVFVVRGASEFDRFYEQIARRQFGEYEDRLAITYLPALPLSDLRKEVAQLPADSIVYFVSLFEDGAGAKLIPVDVLGVLSAAANAPIYCWPEMTLGYGVVGGSLLSEERVAVETARLALRVLDGEDPERVATVVAQPYVTTFDWRQLQRWGIPENRLPADSEVRFRSPTAWELYRWPIVGALAIMFAQAALIGALLVQRRQRRRAESALQGQRVQLAHAGRLATVGELTATIAHEINQPLGAILSNADAAELLLESGPGALDEVRGILADIRKDDLRASEVIERLRSLLAKHPMSFDRIDLNEVIAQAMRLLEAEANRREIEFETRFESGLPMVLADRVHIQQVVLNLVINAMDAMAGIDAGRRRVVVQTSARRGGEVEVAVMDCGRGLAPTDRDRLFEAYFTTKDHGMGLGLSIARTIVEAHGGRIWADAAEHRSGAVFRFTLPEAAAASRRLLATQTEGRSSAGSDG